MKSHQQEHAILDDLADRIICGERHLVQLRLLKPELYDAAHQAHLLTVAQILKTIATISHKRAVNIYDTLAPISKVPPSHFTAAIGERLIPARKSAQIELAINIVAGHHIRNL